MNGVNYINLNHLDTIGNFDKFKACIAYEVNGDVYFSVESDPKYGELSHQKLEDLNAGARVEENNQKNFDQISHLFDSYLELIKKWRIELEKIKADYEQRIKFYEFCSYFLFYI